MAQISKLYTFYLKKIFKKNWIRITLVSLFLLGVVWFGLPYLAFKNSTKGEKEGFFSENSLRSLVEDPDTSNEDKEELQKIIQAETKLKIGTFRDWNRVYFGNEVAKIRKIQRSLLEKKITRLAEKKKSEASEEELGKIKGEIFKLEMGDKGKVGGINLSLFNTDNSLFFNRAVVNEKGKSFWKILNNISWWNLTGFIVTFFLFFNILDKTFYHPQKDGEEAMVLTFTPGVKRSDLLFAKILAFLTFFSLINILLFLLPYGFYYFWAGSNISIGAFALLSLYTLVVGPILFFGLILAPYIFINSWSGLAGGIFSSALAFFPMVWQVIIKTLAFKFHTWPYTIEEKFLDPAIFTVVSVIFGIIFLSLYYWKYQEQDLGN